MGKVSIKHISIQNFCNQANFDADFSDKTIIKGRNREGKSTIRNAILWVLLDKLADGSSAGDNIRNHDENGVRQDGTDIRVDLTMDVDGAEYVLTKIQRQKWVKRRGCEDREFQGNENLYEISGVPKKAKDFEQFINNNICPTDDLAFCINASTFLTLDAKKRRAKVLSLGKEFTNDEIIDKYPEFAELRNDLKVGTIEELTARSKKAITELKKRQVELPTRIDEVQNSIVDADFAELELGRNDINNKLQAIEAANAKAANIREDINKAKIDLVTIKEKLSGSAKEMRHNLELSISNLKKILSDTNYTLDRKKDQVASLRSDISIKEMQKQNKEQELAAVESAEIATDSFICSECGQVYPAEKQAEIRANKERRRASEIDALKTAIEQLDKDIESEKNRLPDDEEILKEIEEKIVHIRSEVTAKEMELSGIHDDVVDYTENDEYKAVESKIADLEKSLNEITSSIGDKEELMSQLAYYDRQLAQKDANEKAKDRIEELKGELKSVGAKILTQEHTLYLLEQFNIKRIEMLETSVNSYFDIIRWRFFIPQINGGYSEVCKATVEGTDYDTLLNKSDRLLCQTDLVLGFQKAANVMLPVAIDDCESIDSDRIPELDNQTLVFRRDDCKLTVENA